MNINNLQKLYTDGQIEECVSQLEIYLLINPENTEALSLKALCIRDITYRENDTEQPNIYSLLKPAFDCYNKILLIDPDNENALVDNLELANYHLNDIDENEYLKKTVKLLEITTNPESLKKAVNFKSLLYEKMQNFDETLDILDDLIALQKELYKNNRIVRDDEVAYSTIRKTNILRYQLNDPRKAAGVFSENFRFIASNSAYFFIDIALLGLEEEYYTLAGNAAEKAFLTSTNGDDEIVELTNLFYKIEEKIDRKISDRSLIKSYLLGQRILQNNLGIDATHLIITAQSYVQQFPDWFAPHHFTGVAYFWDNDYEKAVLHITKALKPDAYAITVLRYIQSYYYLNGTLPEIASWPDCQPRDYYNTGVDFGDFELTISNALSSNDLVKIRMDFYERAMKGFRDYFNNDAYDSDFYTSHHLVAMCCNNYGIALKDAKEYDKAINILSEGLTYSDFWELHYSLAEAYFYSEQYAEAVKIFDRVLEYEIAYSSLPSYFKTLSRKVICYYYLDQKTSAQELFDSLEAEYANAISDVDKSSLDAEELKNWNQAMLEMQNARHTLLMDLSPEEAIKKWHAELEKDPDDNSNWYMLMQQYYQLKDYKNCVACADNYEAVKPANELALSDYKKLHYMRGKSLLRLHEEGKAIKNFDNLINAYTGELTDVHYSELSDIRHAMTEAYFNTAQWDKSMANAEELIKIYDIMNWHLADEWLSCLLLYADAARKAKQEVLAKQILKNILVKFPNNEEARERLKNVKTGWTLFKRK